MESENILPAQIWWSDIFNPSSFGMAKKIDKLAQEIRDLTDVEKVRLIDVILTDLDKPDPEIDRVWADEARKRWAAYKAGKIPTVTYESVMAKHRVKING